MQARNRAPYPMPPDDRCRHLYGKRESGQAGHSLGALLRCKSRKEQRGKLDKGGGPYRNSSDRPGSRQGRCQERTGQRMSEGRRSRLRFIEEKDVHHQQDAGRHPADQYQRRAG